MINEEKRLLKVFLCHASGDKPPVRKLYKELVAEGVDAWLDQEKLLPGQDWRLEIPKAVEEADVVVICLSKKSITKEGYVQKEIKFALDIAEEKPEGTIFLIPARLEECIVPERLSRWQWVDLYEEDGFVKLLRSLKLRANKVGAVIELISYQESDKEIQHRLNQLYTDGLAAFYTEDWDKACFCFQTILSERPDHRNATEKLAEAECERKLARLYVSSTEAVQSENWPVAIETLEELLQKSPDYKDAAQLLRDARKREQLQELYAEAKTLYDAQKWRAVVKVFEQISVLEPNYPDANSLLASAEKEVAEADRLARLNEQYSQALRAMDGDDWYEARKLLEIVHKSQTGFLETEKLLRKVENGILREEEKRRQHEQIETLYEQAHGFVRSQKWRKALDKLEEIRALDDQFSDPDQLATRIETELEHEEQEAERQDRLAALYAEAVRLLKEGRSQEALDKWHEINGIDPKYPDRQWVQRTAKKALTRQAKSTPAKAQFAISKSIWIGLSGIAVVASLMLGIYLTTRGNGDLNLPDPGDPQNNNTSSSGPVDPQVLPPKLELRVNYGDNWVESFYEAGHKVKITLTQSDGVSVKATAKVVTEPKEDWNGVPGFQTSDSSWFDADGNSMAGRPDIQPSDWVIGSVDNGATAKVQIGNIHGAVDLTGDSIEGSISAPWFPDKLGVECHPWGAPESTDMKFDTVEPNGVDPYACSWAGEWDIQWNQRVGVGYFGPDGHWVANTFVSPTIRAHAVWDSVDAWNWPQGAVLHLTIDDPDTLRYPDLEMDMSAQVDPDLGSVWFDFAGKYDLKPGDEVTLTNGVTTKRLIVSILSINTVDIEADTVSGSAEPGALVRLPVPKELFATADPEGNWVANLVEVGVNVGPGTSLIAELNDDDGDMTSFEMDVR